MKHANDVNALGRQGMYPNMDAMAIHPVPMCRLQTLLHQVHLVVAVMKHANDVNALEEARHVSKIRMQWQSI